MTQQDVMDPPLSGSAKTREFYDQKGWKTTREGRTVDVQMFGVTEVGPLREETHALRIARIRQELAKAGGGKLIEVGCGAAPSLFLADLFNHMTAVDFSETGIKEAEAKLSAAGVDHETRVADACDLPYPSESFDAAFSSHMLYHIPNPAAQEKAIGQIMRLLRPGGTAVFVLANPWPVLFPVRVARRLLGVMPVISGMLNRLRKKPPLPYRPMSIGWTKRRLNRFGKSRVLVYAIPSVWFLQHVSERAGVGKKLWRAVSWLERKCPRLSAGLGNFFIVTITKDQALGR